MSLDERTRESEVASNTAIHGESRTSVDDPLRPVALSGIQRLRTEWTGHSSRFLGDSSSAFIGHSCFCFRRAATRRIPDKTMKSTGLMQWVTECSSIAADARTSCNFRSDLAGRTRRWPQQNPSFSPSTRLFQRSCDLPSTHALHRRPETGTCDRHEDESNPH